MKSFIVKSINDNDLITMWIVNAESKEEAKEMVMADPEFEEEDIVSCDEFNHKRRGVVFIEASVY